MPFGQSCVQLAPGARDGPYRYDVGELVVMGAQMMCEFGAAPMPLAVIPEGAMVTATTPAATIMECEPIVNIPPFGICNSPSNPAAVAAKAAGATVPCTPVTTPWLPGAPTVQINGMPALTSDSRCSCALGLPECISIIEPGQVIVTVSG